MPCFCRACWRGWPRSRRRLAKRLQALGAQAIGRVITSVRRPHLPVGRLRQAGLVVPVINRPGLFVGPGQPRLACRGLARRWRATCSHCPRSMNERIKIRGCRWPCSLCWPDFVGLPSTRLACCSGSVSEPAEGGRPESAFLSLEANARRSTHSSQRKESACT